jgi:hypothetical protein
MQDEGCLPHTHRTSHPENIPKWSYHPLWCEAGLFGFFFVMQCCTNINYRCEVRHPVTAVFVFFALRKKTTNAKKTVLFSVVIFQYFYLYIFIVYFYIT